MHGIEYCTKRRRPFSIALCCSEMLLHLIEPLVVSSVLLAHPIAIEFTVQAAELIGLALAIVALEVGDKLGSHMGVLLSSTDASARFRASALHEPSSVAPDREDDAEEVSKPQDDTLLGVLNPQGVQVHMEFRGEVGVED